MNNKKILMFVENDYEDLELWYPKLRLIEAGARVIVAGPEKDRIYLSKHGYACESDFAVNEIDPSDFNGLVIPGGFAPDRLRRLPAVLEITRTIMEQKKLLAHICHAGWIPISAGVVHGFRCTSTPGIKDDLINAGAAWEDKPVVVDRNMISSRRPADLPLFCREIIRFLSEKD
jgi:protease I